MSEPYESASIDSMLDELRRQLKRLHRSDGEPSTREVAKRTGGAITHTTVHSVLRSARLPRWGPLELVVDALKGDVEEFRRMWIAIRDAADVLQEVRSGQPSTVESVDPDSAVSATKSVSPAGLDLAERVRVVVAALTKTNPDELAVDGDGDIGIRAGSAMVFVRVRDNPPLVDVSSPVLTGVEPSEKLFVRLSELTSRFPVGRIYCTSGTVWASVPVFGRDFQATHLSLAIQVMTGLADELDDRLYGEFGGRRFFEDPPNSS